MPGCESRCASPGGGTIRRTIEQLLELSFAHGRSIYLLRHDLRSAKAALAQVPAGAVVDLAMAILDSSELEADELTDFAATVAKAASLGVKAVMARIAKERRERGPASHRREARSVSAAAAVLFASSRPAYHHSARRRQRD